MALHDAEGVDQGDLADPGRDAGAGDRRAGPLRHVEQRADRLFLEWRLVVVGQCDLHVDALPTQLGDQARCRCCQASDPGQWGELGRGEQHFHERSVNHRHR
jgi:hypothetical protein